METCLLLHIEVLAELFSLQNYLEIFFLVKLLMIWQSGMWEKKEKLEANYPFNENQVFPFTERFAARFPHLGMECSGSP